MSGGWTEVEDGPPSPDRPVLTNALGAIAGAVADRAVANANSVVQAAFRAAELQAAEMRSEADMGVGEQGALFPWQTLGEQFAILEEELRARILQVSQSESNFTPELANRARRPGSILPSCTPMASAALAGDEALRDLRFRLVPARLTEEAFWRCYFWHVANIKCELLHDWRTANSTRREAVLDKANLTAEALSSASSPKAFDCQPHDTEGIDARDLDAEFERLVSSPS
jgi:hypothetical protein